MSYSVDQFLTQAKLGSQMALAWLSTQGLRFKAWSCGCNCNFTTLAILGLIGALSILTLVGPWLLAYVRCFFSNNLKKRYNAKWALVTGGSSGIGLSLCKKLAAQGLNIVMVAVPDPLLEKSAAELAKAFPDIEVRSVGADLSAPDHNKYLDQIKRATDDILVQVVFSNAGYMVTGFFSDTPLEKWMANQHCNQGASIAIAHHFVGKMRAAGAKGCVVFTSSPANIIPSPFSTLYGATKAAVTHFASSLACEVRGDGIDVSVLHPSPVATNFYKGAHAMPTLQMFKSTATGPDMVADCAIRGAGRVVFIDQGYYPFVMRLLLRIVDFSFLAELLPTMATMIEDYRFLKAAQAKAAAAAPAVVMSAPVVAGVKEEKKEEKKKEKKAAAAPASAKKAAKKADDDEKEVKKEAPKSSKKRAGSASPKRK